MVDARDGRPVFQALQGSGFDIAAFWREAGYTVVETVQGPPLRSPFVAVNCVGLVKAALCIHAPFAVTPHQLYRHLIGGRHETARLQLEPTGDPADSAAA